MTRRWLWLVGGMRHSAGPHCHINDRGYCARPVCGIDYRR